MKYFTNCSDCSRFKFLSWDSNKSLYHTAIDLSHKLCISVLRLSLVFPNSLLNIFYNVVLAIENAQIWESIFSEDTTCQQLCQDLINLLWRFWMPSFTECVNRSIYIYMHTFAVPHLPYNACTLFIYERGCFTYIRGIRFRPSYCDVGWKLYTFYEEFVDFRELRSYVYISLRSWK